VVNLTEEKKRPSFWISKELYAAIEERLRKKEQTILFLNRRGFAFFVQCAACGTSLNCTDCSVSLTLHQDNILYCHYCSYKRPMPLCCPHCSAPESQFLKKGIGTQKVCALLATLFPHARIARADLDTTKSKKEWQKTVEDFYAGALDILVGTQTITKGYDFPKVTLVGILWADLNLHFPQYNATETTLQQLIQVAGRAGRHTAHSQVIVQTMSQHNVFSYIDELRYRDFCTAEMPSRHTYGYPPYKQLCMLFVQHKDEASVEKDAQAITYALTTLRTRAAKEVQILGTSKPPVHRVQKIHVREVYLKAGSMQDILFIYNALNHSRYKSSILFMPGVV
jgi:primosomal protein N' (replication factor Y)